MTDPTLQYPPPPDAPSAPAVPLSPFDRVRPAIAPVVGFLVSLVCGALVARYGERFRFAEVPVEVQVAVTVAVLNALQYLCAELAKLVAAAHWNPSSSASPTFAKAAKASPIGSASEGAQNIAALAQTGERPTASLARSFAAPLPASAIAAMPAPGSYHTVEDAGTHDDDGHPL